MAIPEDGCGERSAQFAEAWGSLDEACAARLVLAECWPDLGDAGFSSSVVTDAEGRCGQIDVFVNWPDAVWERADSAARRFVEQLREAFDHAVLAAAGCVSGAVQSPDPGAHRMPWCMDRAEFRAQRESGDLVGLRPDQVRHVELFQPYEPSPVEAGTPVAKIRRLMRHLSTVSEPSRRRSGRAQVAVWAHSAVPHIEVDPPQFVASLDVTEDGVLEQMRTVAHFSLDGDGNSTVQGNPNIAFDLIFNDEPWPQDPDDNLIRRTVMLIYMASEFICGLERSIGLRAPVHPERELRYTEMRGIQETLWAPLDMTDSQRAAQVIKALSSSDIGLATHRDDDGTLTMLVKVEDSIYGRPIPPALRLDPTERQGQAAEDATLAAASIWGLPDFVLHPRTTPKGAGWRQIGDGTIITGGKGLAIQVKSRESVSENLDRERSWLLKKAKEGARQAAGTIRALHAAPTTLINGRGRAISCDGSTNAWVRVVILDHSTPPDNVIPQIDNLGIAAVAILRRDWEFLFNQLRSVSAVVDYFHRVASDKARPLGDEPARYYELADADEKAVQEAPPPWVAQLGAEHFSQPLLPKAPVSSADATGHTVFRIILEDIAESPFERDEADRLQILALLDRFSVSQRAALGRLLLTRLDDVIQAPVGTTLWRNRRVIQDEGGLHLAFNVCSQFTEVHREAFRQWAMLRHHEFIEAEITPMGETPWTVAVLLTPRYDRYRPWDTTTVTIRDTIELSTDELADMRALWNSHTQQETA